jgi:hypothetical protein
MATSVCPVAVEERARTVNAKIAMDGHVVKPFVPTFWRRRRDGLGDIMQRPSIPGSQYMTLTCDSGGMPLL